MKRMTRKARVFVGVLFVLTLFITLFAAYPRAKAATIGVGYVSGGAWLDSNEANPFIVVSCPSGQLLLGGGWSSSSTDMYVWRSMQLGTSNSWMIGATNKSSTRQYVSVWAACASGSIGSASARSISKTVTVSGHNTGCATLLCTSPRSIASGGGFNSSSYDPSVLSLTTTRPTNDGDGEWKSCFYNPTTTNKTFTAYAVCTNLLSGGNYRVVLGSGASIPGGGNTGYDYAYCNSDEKAISGGFETWLSDSRFEPDNWPTVRLFYNFLKGAYSQWRVSAYYAGSGPAQLQLTSWAKCFKP